MKDLDKTQELLESLSPKPLPPELRDKILLAVHQRKTKPPVITPAVRVATAISCVLIVLALGFNAMIRNNENQYLTAMMGVSPASEAIIEKELQEVATELFKIEYDEHLNQWLVRYYRSKKKTAKIKTYQSIIDILKE